MSPSSLLCFCRREGPTGPESNTIYGEGGTYDAMSDLSIRMQRNDTIFSVLVVHELYIHTFSLLAGQNSVYIHEVLTYYGQYNNNSVCIIHQLLCY